MARLQPSLLNLHSTTSPTQKSCGESLNQKQNAVVHLTQRCCSNAKKTEKTSNERKKGFNATKTCKKLSDIIIKQSNANPLDEKLRTDREAAYKQEQELCAPLKRKSLCERKQEEEAARAKKTGQPVRSIMQCASWHACVRHPCMVCSSSYIVVWPCFCIMLHVFIVWGHRGAGHCMKSARAWRRKMLHKRFVVFSSQLGMLVTYAHHLALVGNAFYELACFVAVC